ncbi:MAG: toxin TcdB middle/N-terminal domain-containing protein, partial [Myxococcota bacterium]
HEVGPEGKQLQGCHLTRYTNGIGAVTDISYETAAQQMAKDGGRDSWPYAIPFPMNVVSRLDQYDLLTNLHEVTTYRYHEGFYDGQEKQFRGFARVLTQLEGNETIEEGWTEEVFDVGVTDTYHHGKLLRSLVSSGGRDLYQSSMSYEDCPIAEVPDDTELPVRYICTTESQMIDKEGLSQERWVTSQTQRDYDGYGNVVWQVDFGVTDIGGSSCEPCERDASIYGAPCGQQCLGDERTSITEYITPGDNTAGRWLLGLATHTQTMGREGDALVAESWLYYDGNDFEGLNPGQATHGRVARVEVKRDLQSEYRIEVSRSAYDEHGNVVATLDPLGEIGGHSHQRQYTYSDDGLRVVQADILLEDSEGQPYLLSRTVHHEPLYDKPAETTAWVRVVNGEIVSTRRATSFEYDVFGRMRARFEPGNTSAEPDTVYEYDLQSPSSRIISRSRSQQGGPLDLVQARCLDGRGRPYQVRTRTDGETYQVSGLTLFNIRSEPVKVYQPYTASSEQCDTSAPNDVLSTNLRYDATGRQLEVTLPDSSIHGEPSTTRSVYEPLMTYTYDAEDTDPQGPYTNTPRITHTDGIGRTVAHARQLEANGAAHAIGIGYDG